MNYFFKWVHLFNQLYVNYAFAVISWNIKIEIRINTSKYKLIVFRAASLLLAPTNIISINQYFEHSKIFPLNPEIFAECDFMPSFFYDRPAPVKPNLGNINNPNKILNIPQKSIATSPLKKEKKH